jgi:hypothetical protein
MIEETAAINALQEISNQETNYEWIGNKTRHESSSMFTKKRKTT